MSVRNGVIKSSITIVFFYFFAKVLSFLVEMIIASKYGACFETDAYYLTEGTVMAISPLLTIGVWKVFMPEYKRLIVKNQESDAVEFTESMLAFFLMLSVLLSLVFFLFPSIILNVFAPGYNEKQVEYSSDLIRVFSFIFVFGTVTIFPSAILQSRSLFSKSQLKEIIVFLFPLIYLLVFSEFGQKGLAISLLVGHMIAMFVMYYYLLPYFKISLSPKITIRKYGNILKLYPIACINAVLLQLNAVIDKMFSSTLVVGSISFMNYGAKVINFFNGIISTAISMALFPYLAEMIAKKEDERFRSFFVGSISILCAILFPMTCVLSLFSIDIISILFGHGKFSGDDIQITSKILFIYGIGLPAMGITTIVNDIFYINKQVKILMYTSVVNIISNIILDFLLIDKLGVVGLCMATTISLYVSLLIKLFYMREIVSANRFLIGNIISVMGACVFSMGTFYFIKKYMEEYFVGYFYHFICGVIIFFALYLVVLQSNKYYRTQCMTIIMNLKKRI